jgi:hypothetical protein
MSDIHLVVQDDGIPPTMWSATIVYDFKNSHHVYTSKEIPGLYIASLDKKEARSHVIPAIQSLFWHAKNKKVKVFVIRDYNDDLGNTKEEPFSGLTVGIVPCEDMKVAA